LLSLFVFGSARVETTRGLALRMDYGTQYLSHCLNKIRYWGIMPSFTFVELPLTDSVTERFNGRSRNKPFMAGCSKVSHMPIGPWRSSLTL
jgi:hypothetical protein